MKKLIASSKVVSEPGAAITVTTHELTPEGRELLTVRNVDSLPSPITDMTKLRDVLGLVFGFLICVGAMIGFFLGLGEAFCGGTFLAGFLVIVLFSGRDDTGT